MSMEGMTGLNNSVARENIKNFYYNAASASGNIRTTFEQLFEELKIVWASEKAVNFSKTYLERISKILNDFDNELSVIVHNATRAYNIVADAHGMNASIPMLWFLDEPGVEQYDGLMFFPIFSENINGVTGMNINEVRNIISTYEPKLQVAVQEISAIPTAIALYDDENGQQVAFSNNINAMKTNFEMLIFEIFAVLKANLETETDTILLAKEKSTSTLSGNE